MLRPKMFQRSRLAVLLGLLTCSLGVALMAPACTITSDGGFGGDEGLGGDNAGGGKASGGHGAGGKAAGGNPSSGGQSAAGTNAGGNETAGGNGGEASGGSEPLDCQSDGTAEGIYAGLDEMAQLCDACLEDQCLSEWEQCNAADPSAACRWGTVNGVDDAGEFDCMLTCFRELGEQFVGDEVDLETCAAQCGSSECDPTSAGPVAVALSECLIASPGDLDGCQVECNL